MKNGGFASNAGAGQDFHAIEVPERPLQSSFARQAYHLLMLGVWVCVAGTAFCDVQGITGGGMFTKCCRVLFQSSV